MLKNKIIVKKIRNIFILLMAIIIMIGVYRNIRNSRAENVIQIEMEVADKNKLLENQTITVDATETKDGNFLVELPTSVNENIVTKYYTADGAEVTMTDENSDKTLRLTETEVANKKIKVETDYDTEEVMTVDQQKELFYNKEIRKPADENGNGEGDVIATGYMPLDAKAEINEIDLATLTAVKIPNENQTMRKAYEVSIYQEVAKQADEENNTDTTVTEEQTETETKATNENTKETQTMQENSKTEEQTNKENVETERIEYDASKYSETVIIKTRNTEENTIPAIYSIENNTVTEVPQTMIDGEYIYAEFEKKDDKISYILATEPKLEENNNDVASDDGTSDTTSSESNIATVANTPTTNVLKSISGVVKVNTSFWGNSKLETQYVESVRFVKWNSNFEKNENRWDVSEKNDGSVMAYYETGTSSKVYVVYVAGKNNIIYAPQSSRYLFSNIGSAYECKATNAIEGLGLLDTTYVTDMTEMFSGFGRRAMTSLDLGSNFNTSNVTNMSGMFYDCGYTAMTSLNLGSNFNTINVTDMNNMFRRCGYTAMTSLDLGSNFNTSNVTNMSGMFYDCGYTAMTSLNLGSNFNTINVTDMNNMFRRCGYTAMTSLDLGSNFNTSNVTNMKEMFGSCGYTAMTSLDLGSKFNTSNVTDMEGMFAYCGRKAMTSLNLGSNFNTSNVVNMREMFQYCGFGAMTSLELGDKFNTSNVTNMRDMFHACGYTAMTSLDLGSNFNTINVTDMSWMFFECGHTAMISLDLGSNFNTSNVTDMTEMFRNCGLTAMRKMKLGKSFTTIPANEHSNFLESCGKSNWCSIIVPAEIYKNEHALKLNSTSTETISYTRGTIALIDTTAPTFGMVRYKGRLNGNTGKYGLQINIGVTDESNWTLDKVKVSVKCENKTVKTNRTRKIWK